MRNIFNIEEMSQIWVQAKTNRDKSPLSIYLQ